MQTFIPSNRIASNFEMIARATLVIPRAVKNWSVQQRIPHLALNSVNKSRAIEDVKLSRAFLTSPETMAPAFEGKKVFLVAKKKNSKFYPIGVSGVDKNGRKLPPRGFSSLAGLKEFAKSLGRSKVRVGCIVSSVN